LGVPAFMGLARAVLVDIWIPVPLAGNRAVTFLVPGPHGVFVEAVLDHGVGMGAEIVDLPLAGGRGPVSGRFQDPREGDIVFPIEVGRALLAPGPARDVPMGTPAMMVGISPREEGNAGRRADGHGIEGLE